MNEENRPGLVDICMEIVAIFCLFSFLGWIVDRFFSSEPVFLAVFAILSFIIVIFRIYVKNVK